MLGEEKQIDGTRRDQPPAEESGVIGRTRAEMMRLIRRGKHQKALNVAKRAHKQLASAASETLLVEAYTARLEGLSAAGLHQEAAALADLVAARFGAKLPRFEELRLVEMVRGGKLDEVLRPLTDPEIAPEQRTFLENLIKRELLDPAMLARSAALSQDHPLKAGAAALARAFEAVTSGPVPDAETELREISRRSPLAPWKHLVRAIACFYRNEDAKCERHLLAIDEEASPARLIPAIRALLNGQQAQAGTLAKERLRTAVHGSRTGLRSAFERLDDALSRRDLKGSFRLIKDAVAECRRVCPELVAQLQQQISVRCWLLELPFERLRRAMGGPALKDAQFWRLFARAHERNGLILQACGVWEEFRRSAIAQGWFKAEGVEEAAIYLHMASLLHAFGPKELARVRPFAEKDFPSYHDYYVDQPPSVRAAAPEEGVAPDLYFLYPESLFERATRMDPHPETFRRCLEWARNGMVPWRRSDGIAQAWHEAAPADPRPLLYLIESAEKRRAFKKALGHLQEAERANLLDPEVRRAGIRLELARFRRHIQQRKPHLAAKDLTRLATLPEFGKGDRPALLEALRWIQVTIRDGKEAGRELQDRVCQLLDGAEAGILLLRGAADWCGLPHGQWPAEPRMPKSRGQKELLPAATRACVLGHSIGISIPIPRGWRKTLEAELAAPSCRVDGHGLRCLAEAAVEEEAWSLAYSASGAGLRQGGAPVARFLLLRARSLPVWFVERLHECLAVVTELARRQGDAKLVEEANELRRYNGLDEFGRWRDPPGNTSPALNQETVEELLSRERKALKYPENDRYRGVDFGPDDAGEDDLLPGLELESSFPPEVFKQLLELLGEVADESPESGPGRSQRQLTLEDLLDGPPPPRKTRRRGRKKN
ncbi:MAG: hypothetical protein V2A76_09545 [Planctomycetota bacterium]